MSADDVSSLAQYLSDNKYDTESIELDFLDVNTSNICQAVRNPAVAEVTRFQLQSKKRMCTCDRIFIRSQVSS